MKVEMKKGQKARLEGPIRKGGGLMKWKRKKIKIGKLVE